MLLLLSVADLWVGVIFKFTSYYRLVDYTRRLFADVAILTQTMCLWRSWWKSYVYSSRYCFDHYHYHYYVPLSISKSIALSKFRIWFALSQNVESSKIETHFMWTIDIDLPWMTHSKILPECFFCCCCFCSVGNHVNRNSIWLFNICYWSCEKHLYSDCTYSTPKLF